MFLCVTLYFRTSHFPKEFTSNFIIQVIGKLGIENNNQTVWTLSFYLIPLKVSFKPSESDTSYSDLSMSHTLVEFIPSP